MKINFIANTKYWFGFSLILILISAGAMLANQISHGSLLKYSIDFTGGTIMDIQTPATKNRNELESVLKEYQAQISSSDNLNFTIKMKNIDNETHQKLLSQLKTSIGDFEELKFETKGPSIGESMKKKAWIAIAITLVIILGFITFAFREIPKELSAFRFGVAAMLALAHDVIITTGVFALLGLFMGTEIDALFITAMLTVLGYSINDTIVVFDRVRENARFARPSESFTEICEKSIHQTIARSFNTSFSTLLPLLAIFFLGAPSVKVFVLALIVGISIGTYSSIFIATPIISFWYEIKKISR
ncbi:MAG TPA: protein translocase subunit SecF [Candidatus Gracilibacteria bacterium]|nr:protein translocase subunit SecF [Candidatus Gracilibacteria bacterium]